MEEAMMYAVPALIAGAALFAAYRVTRHWLRVRAAWRSGLTAEGRCLKAYTRTSGGDGSQVHTTLHHVYEFTARDGRPVRFEEEGGRATVVEGDVVTVYYADGPHVRATARPPKPARQAATSLLLLAFLGVVVAFCVDFAITFHEAV
jgi:hypothetical protein